MKASDRAKILATLAGLMLVSGAFGALLGARWERRELRLQFDPQNWNEYAMRLIDQKLRLSPEQRVRVRAAIDQAVGEMKTLHRDTVRETGNVVNRMLGAIDRELTPEQRKIAETLVPAPEQVTIDLLKVQERPAP